MQVRGTEEASSSSVINLPHFIFCTGKTQLSASEKDKPLLLYRVLQNQSQLWHISHDSDLCWLVVGDTHFGFNPTPVYCRCQNWYWYFSQATMDIHARGRIDLCNWNEIICCADVLHSCYGADGCAVYVSGFESGVRGLPGVLVKFPRIILIIIIKWIIIIFCPKVNWQYAWLWFSCNFCSKTSKGRILVRWGALREQHFQMGVRGLICFRIEEQEVNFIR